MVGATILTGLRSNSLFMTKGLPGRICSPGSPSQIQLAGQILTRLAPQKSFP